MNEMSLWQLGACSEGKDPALGLVLCSAKPTQAPSTDTGTAGPEGCDEFNCFLTAVQPPIPIRWLLLIIIISLFIPYLIIVQLTSFMMCLGFVQRHQ